MTQKIIHVEGMTCGHCVETITQAVNVLDGVNQVLVDLESKQVSVDFDDNRTNIEAVTSKIVEAGFEVIPN